MPTSAWRTSVAYELANDVPDTDIAWEYLRRDENYARDFRRMRALQRAEIEARAAFSDRWRLRFRGRPALPCQRNLRFLDARRAA